MWSPKHPNTTSVLKPMVTTGIPHSNPSSPWLRQAAIDLSNNQHTAGIHLPRGQIIDAELGTKTVI